MRRPLATAAACLALVGTLAACREQPPEDPGGSEYVVGDDDTYVAIGDSYTAAPRTGPLASTDGCGSTITNYPHLIADETDVELLDNSCNGASTQHLTEPKRTGVGSHPPQLEGIDRDTDLVTFRLGANDYGLIGRVFLCAQGVLGEGRGTSPCTDLDEAAGDAGVDGRLVEVAANVERGLREVRDRAPDARIIVVGYPQIVPPRGRCDLLPLPAGDYPWARRVIEGLNEALAGAADAVDATYVDMFDVTAGHDICGDDPWVAGIRTEGGAATPWHPYREESLAVSELVLEELEK